MDGIVIYTAIFWFFVACLQAVSHCTTTHGFIAWIVVQSVILPIYGRVFGWW